MPKEPESRKKVLTKVLDEKSSFLEVSQKNKFGNL
jgi:hypothetical protein